MYRVQVNIRPVVYCTAISEGGENEWNFLWDRFQKENVAAEQVVILSALGCTKNPTILKVFHLHTFIYLSLNRYFPQRIVITFSVKSK